MRLFVRVKLTGQLTGPPPPLRRLGVPASQLQMVGHGRGPGTGRIALVPAGEDVGGPAVQQAPPGQSRRFVGGSPQCLVGEAVGRGLVTGSEGGWGGGWGDLGQQ